MAIDIWDIVEINERDGFFRCTIQMTRKWIDQKVTFQNLQRDEELNIINPEDRSLLWKPWTVYKNIEDRDKYGQTDANQVWRVIPNTNFSYEHAEKTFLHNTYLFDGASNMISFEISYTVEWLCDFQMEWFPFDTQSCTMEFHQAKSTPTSPSSTPSSSSSTSLLSPTSLHDVIPPGRELCSTSSRVRPLLWPRAPSTLYQVQCALYQVSLPHIC